ncbi:sulfurtransferase TusA [Volucribacter psittacicida]|uniref:Sulfurtransferase TusA n=1 Tax=Volucribacter psittacicida TaxID=203482 RepID=A0A4R1G460_9PAST|nr:sulfurtransferase TusA [Volucribacter psittacicida]
MQYQLDLRQYHCPLPLLMTKQALNRLNVGDELILWLNSVSIVQDFVLLCQERGDELQIISEREVKIRKIY